MTIVLEVSVADRREYSRATGGLSITDGLASVPAALQDRILRSRFALVDRIRYGEVAPDPDVQGNGNK